MERKWRCDQVWLHRPDTTLIELDPANGADLELSDHFQIFVRTPKGNSTLIWVSATDSVRDLKYNISNQIGYPVGKQHLLIGARSLQDFRYIKDYNIKPGSTLSWKFSSASSGARQQ